jgi:hypothetical protein
VSRLPTCVAGSRQQSGVLPYKTGHFLDLRVLETEARKRHPATTVPTTTPAEQSLINDSDVRQELAQFSDAEGAVEARPLEPRPPYLDGFEALDSGLATDADASGFASAQREYVPVDEIDELPAHRSARVEFRISFMTAALVLLACLTAGAVTAAYVFQERLTPVTGRPSASR